jgi:hypothetical protein
MVIMSTPGAQMHTAKIPAPITRVQIRHLIVHDIATKLPKCLSRNDLSWLVPLKLEHDPAFEYVPENRSGMAMRRQPGVYGWKFDELSHRMCQHVFDANPNSALAVGHFCTANRGQFNLNHALTAAIGPTPPALPTMRSRKR